MNSDRKAAIIVGVLFLLGFAGAFSAVILKPILDDPNLLINLTKNKNLVMLGAFLELVMAFGCANNAIWLYPVLKKHNKFLALGAVGSRIIENVFQIVGTLGLLLLLTLSQEAAKADAPAASTFQTAVALLLTVRFWAPLVFAQIAFCLGTVMYNYVFYHWFNKEKMQYCPGEICDVKARQEIQKTSFLQIGIIFYKRKTIYESDCIHKIRAPRCS
ncbi:MAG: DUF4386 domain-containing protein [Candidatus Methanoperedens sp.]|nr:DUF4386 domain-containing protein [Candidatus Methanoperedens sp.]CAG0991008.1 hypothetical protein METP1_02296 [Methanosarcinales archaeon]